jgi:tetratricopeptide (TPR) repeat protein
MTEGTRVASTREGRQSVDADLLQLSRVIDPVLLGERIRQARVAAEMTQGQLAGDDASVAYVSRIEVGKRRPAFALLRVFAERLGTTPEALLLGVSRDRRAELRLALDYAELALRSGQAAEALQKVGDVIDACNDSTDVELIRDSQLAHALSLEALGHLDDAIVGLEVLVGGDEVTGPWILAAMALTRCYRESGDLVRATDVGERALARLRALSLEASDEAVQLTVTVASVYNERGDSRHAIRMCRSAADEAERLNSPKAKAAAYWNASIMESELGRVEAAVPLAKHALTLLQLDDDNRNLAKLHSQLGMFLLATDPADAAGAKESLERAAVQLEWSAATVIERAYNSVALARASLLLGEPDEALARLDEIADAASSAPLLAADCMLLRGQVAGSRGDIEQARACYLDAIRFLSAVGADRSAAQLWADLGTLLDELGETASANTAFRNAAASTGLVLPRGVVGARSV